MSSTFIRPNREDISATLLLAFALASRLTSVDKEESLTAFFLLTGFIAIFFNFVYKLLFLILRWIDYRKGFLPIASLSNAWRHAHFSIFKYRVLTCWRYFFAGLILLIFPSWGSEAFIFSWYNGNGLKVRITVYIFLVVALGLALWESRFFKIRIDIVRVSNAIDGLSELLEKSLNRDDWENVYSEMRGNREDILKKIQSDKAMIDKGSGVGVIAGNQSLKRLVHASRGGLHVSNPNLLFGRQSIDKLRKITTDFQLTQQSGNNEELIRVRDEYLHELIVFEDWIKGLYNLSLR